MKYNERTPAIGFCEGSTLSNLPHINYMYTQATHVFSHQ